MPTRMRKSQLYLRGYPTLIDQINRLVNLVREHDPNMCALILFGSTARLTPHWASDADLLILCQRPDQFSSYALGEQQDRGVYLIVEATSEHDEWPFAMLVSDLQASDLSPALLANIAREGVLLYQREGTALPPALAKLLPYEAWLRKVQALLDTHKSAAQATSA